jgi:hypothetical protein
MAECYLWAMKRLIQMINELTPEIQRMVDAEFAKIGGPPHPDSSLNQLNLLGGDKIIYEYLQSGEIGVAFDHLNYMIDETNIKLPPKTSARLLEISQIIW